MWNYMSIYHNVKSLFCGSNVNLCGCNPGLGEMMPVQLWETTMDPERRLLKQLVVEDAAEANVVFSSLMGARVRKTFGLLFCYLSVLIYMYILCR